MIKVLIADDHQMVRRGISRTLDDEQDIEVVGEGKNGLEILALLESGVSADVLLTDLNMPEMDGLQLAGAVSQRYPHIQVILLTIQEDDQHIQQAFQQGIKSYLFKTANENEVVFAIRQVFAGQPYLCAGLSDRVIKRIAIPPGAKANADGVEFSDRELEALRLIAAGFTNEETADKMFTSKRTVEGYRQSMIDKSGSKNSLALITFAMRHGLLT